MSAICAPAAVTELLERTEIRYDESSETYVIVCPECGDGVCDVDEGDTLGLLARVIIGHLGPDSVDTPCHPRPICSECGDRYETHEGDYGMCGPCLHDALRSGWEPGK